MIDGYPMRTFTLTACCLLAIHAGPPAIARAHEAQPTLRDIEFDTPRDRRELEGRTMLERAIPIGSPVTTARDVLRDRGAHCRGLHGDGVLRCTFGAFDTIENHLQDVTWTIRVASTDGAVTSLDVHRDSRGS
jgi:hypothetical protein